MGAERDFCLGEQPIDNDDVNENQARHQESGNDEPGQVVMMALVGGPAKV
jgi:hypothetical protein